MTKIKVAVAMGILFVAGGYAWACYYAGECVCAVMGSCYAQTVLPTCQIPTCIIADANATTWNVCQGNGPFTGRERIYPDAACVPGICRVYDACNQQYVSLSGVSCWFSVQRYQGIGSGCRS
jgi:hypothetical protein